MLGNSFTASGSCDPGGTVRPSYIARPLYFFPYSLFPSSLSSSCFILAVIMRQCLGKHSCTISSFPIAILNETSFFFATR